MNKFIKNIIAFSIKNKGFHLCVGRDFGYRRYCKFQEYAN